MNNHDEIIERLTTYGQRLVEAGFHVWLTPFRPGGFLTYERGGYFGHLQRSEFNGWAHDMPLVPSREFGSSMFIGVPNLDVWSVEAAEQAASATNHNSVVGTQANAGAAHTWISRDAVPLHFTCYVCDHAIDDTNARQCPECGNHVRCVVDGCDADMSAEKCPNDKASCLGHCGDDDH